MAGSLNTEMIGGPMRIAILIHGLLTRDEGQDLVEYGLLAGLITVVAIGAVTALGFQINNVLWQTVVNNF